jgi:hypothetical protein
VLQGFVVEAADPVFSGVVAYRGLVPRPDDYPADTMRLWTGEGKHFLAFPVRTGRLLNYVGFVNSDISIRESWSAPGDAGALAAHFDGWDPMIGQIIAAISGPGALALYEQLRRERTARVQRGSRRTGAGYHNSGNALIDRRWIYEYDAWAEAVAILSQR